MAIYESGYAVPVEALESMKEKVCNNCWQEYNGGQMVIEADEVIDLIDEIIDGAAQITMGDSIPKANIEAALAKIKARFMSLDETVLQNQYRKEVCREFLLIIGEAIV